MDKKLESVRATPSQEPPKKLGFLAEDGTVVDPNTAANPTWTPGGMTQDPRFSEYLPSTNKKP